MNRIAIKNLIACCFVALATLVALADTWTDPDTGYTWTYRIDGNGAEIYNNGVAAVAPLPMGDVMIPSAIGELAVTKIGENAFRGNPSLSRVTIPGSVTNIGAYAFYGCTNLESVVFNEGLVSLSSGAFAMCTKLASVELPSTLIELGPKEARVSEVARESIFHYGELESYIGLRNGSSALLEVDWMSVASRFGATVVTNIEGSTTSETIAWSHCEDFAGNDATAGVGGFSVTHSSEIVKSEKYIPRADGTFAFETSTVTNNTVVGRFYYNDYGRGVFEGCISLESVMLKQGLERIGAGAFKDCTSLRSIAIPNTVSFIGGQSDITLNDIIVRPEQRTKYTMNPDSTITTTIFLAFVETRPDSLNGTTTRACGFLQGCTNLVDVVLPCLLQYLGPFSFAGCTILESIEMPDSLITLQQGTFSGCERLSHVKFPTSLDLIGGYEWYLREKFTIEEQNAVQVPKADGTFETVVRPIYKLNNSDGTITMWGDIKGLLDYNYKVCVPQPDGTFIVETIMPDTAFYNVDGVLTTLSHIYSEEHAPEKLLMALYPDNRWEDGVVDVEFPPANDCPILSNGGDYLGELICLVNAQYSSEYRQCLEKRNRFCPGAPVYRKQLMFNEFMPHDGVFYGCKSLGGIALPETVRRIGDYAFYDCPNLSLAEVPESLEVVGHKAFGGKTALPNIGAPWQGYDDTLEALLASGKSYEEIGDIVRGLIELVEARGDEICEDDRLAIFKMALNTYQYAVYSYGLKDGYVSFRGISDLLGSLSDLIIGLGVNLSGDVRQQISDNVFDVAVESLINSTSADRDLSGLESFAGIGDLLLDFAYVVENLGGELSSSMREHILNGAFVAVTNSQFCLTSQERDLSGLESFNGTGELLSSYAELVCRIGGELSREWRRTLVYALASATMNSMPKLFSNPTTKNLQCFYGAGEMLSALSSMLYAVGARDILSDSEKLSMAEGLVDDVVTCLDILSNAGVSHPNLESSCGLGEMVFGLEEVIASLDLKLSQWKKEQLEDRVQSAVFRAVDQIIDSGMPIDGVGELYSGLSKYYTAVDSIPVDTIPVLAENASSEEVSDVLGDFLDENLAKNIKDATTYNEFRRWAQDVSVVGNNGIEPAGVAAVKISDKAWLSFALGAGSLVVEDLTGDDISVDSFESSQKEPGAFAFNVAIKDVKISSEADKTRLSTVLGIEGATSLSEADFASENVDAEIVGLSEGKAAFTVKPKESAKGDGSSFFIRVKVNQ